MLPDDVFLEIFGFYKENGDHCYNVWVWHLLVHVCRRWQQVAFASPLHRDLRNLCNSGTPVRKSLGLWPALPIVILYFYYDITTDDDDNIVAALEHPNRVCDICLDVTGSDMEKIATMMQEPFPVLKDLYIQWEDLNSPVLPAEFLGGSAPCLRTIYLERIPFPTLPTLLVFTSDLTSLELFNISPDGYISPGSMVVGLTALPTLRVVFSSNSNRLPPALIECTHPP